MQILRQILDECRADRVFALMIVTLGAWSAISVLLLALNIPEPFTAR